MRNITEDEREVHHVLAGTITAWRGGLHNVAFSFLEDLDRESLIVILAALGGTTAELMDRLEEYGTPMGELFTHMAEAKGIYDHG